MDLNDLEKKLDEQLAKETPESLQLFLENAKLKEQLAAMTYEMNHYKQMCKQLQSKDEEE